MNEKLMEMSREAHSFAHKTEGSSYDNPKYDDAFAQKFSELIVRQCAHIAGKAEYSDTWSEPVEDTIKKHFGVE